MFIAGCAAAGLVVGLFLNVLIDRIPGRESLWPPKRRCHECDRSHTGWAALTPAGRCPVCHHGWARRYAVVPAVNALLWALAANLFDAHLVLVPYLVLFSMLLTVSVIDIQVMRIPDRIVFPTLAVSIALVAAVTAIEGFGARSILYALGGAAGYFVLLLVPHLISPKGMGFGDVKLAAVMGLYLGWLAGTWSGVFRLVFYALFFGAVLGVVLGLAVGLLRKKMGAFPFGPALALGTVITVLDVRQLLLG